MKKLKNAVLSAMVLTVPIMAVGVFMWTVGTSDADAFSGPVTQCVGCHSIWTGGGGAGHTAHNGLGHPQGCNACHLNIGDTPVTNTCGECHVVPGVASRHARSGASTSCTACHGGAAAPENTAVPGYAGLTGITACSDGLDNDGNILLDGSDPACAPTPTPTPGPTPTPRPTATPRPTPPPSTGAPADHTNNEEGAWHKTGKDRPFSNGCTACHGADLRGSSGPSCYKCHGKEWSESGGATSGGSVPADHTLKIRGALHKSGFKTPVTSKCTACHGADLSGGVGPSCFKCHGTKWKVSGGTRSGRDGHDD